MTIDTFAYHAPLLAQSIAAPNYLTPVLFLMLGAGAIAALVATVLGFRRAAAFGSATRWFALSALCLLLYHAQFFVLVAIVINGISAENADLAFPFVAFFNLFVALAAVCAIMGFVRLTDSR